MEASYHNPERWQSELLHTTDDQMPPSANKLPFFCAVSVNTLLGTLGITNG